MLRIAALAGLVLGSLTACSDGADPAPTVPPGGVPVDPTHDPCEGVPFGGRCDGNAVAFCVSGTGSAEPFTFSLPCGDAYACSDGASGAACVPRFDCAPGASECHGSTLARCAGGTWQESACALGCNATPIGAVCRPSAAVVPYTSQLQFEFRTFNAGFTDWGTDVYSAPARRFLIVSVADGEILDATVTDADGRFTLDAVPANLEDGDDNLAAFAVAVADADRLAYALMKPGLPAGEGAVAAIATGGAPSPTPWVWTWTATDVPGANGVYIPLASGSGAAFVYSYLVGVHGFGEALFGARAGTSLAVWLDYGVSWDCGACFLNAPARAFNSDWASQAFIGADADEGFWSGAVLAHELGHWLMATYGAAPGEGGAHILGVPTHPGIAWSEGFATWFSALVRSQRFYYDKQDGLFFWVDFDTRSYSGGVPWYRPGAEYGLEQLIDENEVTRMLLGVTTDANEVALIGAIASPRMTVAPFLRGYLRRTWEGLDANGLPLPAWSTDQSAPHLADFLDALECANLVTADQVDGETEPWAHYPYPSRAPLCRTGELPVQVDWSTSDTTTSAEVRWYVPLSEDLVLGFAPADGPSTVIPAGSPPGVTTLIFTAPARSATVAGTVQRPVGLEVTGAGAGWHVAGRVPYHASALPAPALDGPPVKLRDALSGPSIRLHAVPVAARAPGAPAGPDFLPVIHH